MQEAINLKGWMGATHSAQITHAQVKHWQALMCSTLAPGLTLDPPLPPAQNRLPAAELV